MAEANQGYRKKQALLVLAIFACFGVAIFCRAAPRCPWAPSWRPAASLSGPPPWNRPRNPTSIIIKDFPGKGCQGPTGERLKGEKVNKPHTFLC